ncbi:MAG: tyrosine recombinase [Candidatus Babeliales bacterium]
MYFFVKKFESHLLTERCLSHNTVASYLVDIRQLCMFMKQNGIKDYEHLTLDHTRTFLSLLRKKGIEARSIARKISALRTFLAYVSQHTTYDLHFIKDIELPKLDKVLPKYLTEHEIERVLAVSGNDTSPLGLRNKTMLYVLYASGMRISELVQLKVSDIFFDSGHVIVYGKGDKERMVPLPESIIKLLYDYVEQVLPHIAARYKVLFVRSQWIYLFPVKYGGEMKPITRQSFWILLKKWCKDAGIERDVSPHHLRHSLATHLLKNGADMRSLQLILGHESIATVQLYTHVETTYLREIYDKKHPRAK